VKFGRPTIELKDEFIQAHEKWQSRGITAVKALEDADMRKTSF